MIANHSEGMRMHTILSKRSVAAVLVACLGWPAYAAAVVRTCGSDPVANTTNVLCASPSGPCNASSITVNTAIEVSNQGCVFDVGNRSVSFQKTFEMTGLGFIKVINATSITITSTGKLKARGDYIKPNGDIIGGGTIELTASGAISVTGLIDVNGDPAGMVSLNAVNDITLYGGSEIRGVGISSATGEGAHFAAGGSVDIDSGNGTVYIDGLLRMIGQSMSYGGEITIQAARNINISQPLDASGGAEGGGLIDLSAGDNIGIIRTVNIDSSLGGGDGGDFFVDAGNDALGGVVTGGTFTATETISLEGSSAAQWGGDGGTFYATSQGEMLFDTLANIKANPGTNFDGWGGTVYLESIGADLTIEPSITAKSGVTGGLGGQVDAYAAGDLSLGIVDLGGREAGGDLTLGAGADLSFTGDVTIDAVATGGDGGLLSADGCTLTVPSNVTLDASGTYGGFIELTGNNQVIVSSLADVDATGTGGAITLATRTVTGTNPSTGGTAQFHPVPTILQQPSLPACP